jgi:putative nucleotidyltransferase with HDIG domain
MIDLDALAEAATRLDPLPTSVGRLAGLVAAKAPLHEIVDTVQYDQALTGALLRSANSSWSAPRHEVTTVKDAVVRLGAGPVLSLALGVTVRSRLGTAVPAYGLAEGDLWSHSVAAALAAETLARCAGADLPAETPTAALLHDVGKLVMGRFIDGADLMAIEIAREAGVSRMQAELDVLGIDHAELGGLIAQSWELPSSLVSGIRGHHLTPREVTDGDGASITYGVHLADVVAKVVLAGFGAAPPDDNADLERFAQACGELRVSADRFDEVCRLVGERYQEVAARFGT